MARKRRDILTPESLDDLQFPLQGIDVSTEFELQPAQTTPLGQNVRGWEPGTMRQRGGSRPGLVQYIPQTVNGVHLIQHLNYIVDPGGTVNIPGFSFYDGLYTGQDPLDGGGVNGFNDFSTNNNADGLGARVPPGGRLVRTGGSGIALNRHRATKPILKTGEGFALYAAWIFETTQPGPANVTFTVTLNGTTIDTFSKPWPGLHAPNPYGARLYVTDPGIPAFPTGWKILPYLVAAPVPESTATLALSLFNFDGSLTVPNTFGFTSNNFGGGVMYLAGLGLLKDNNGIWHPTTINSPPPGALGAVNSITVLG